MTVDTGNDTTPRDELNRRFAGMLSELEDAEVALTTRQSELARELADVNTELDRLAKVKKVMLGEPAGRAKRAGTTPRVTEKTKENRRKALAWLAEHTNGANFIAKDMAVAIGVPPQGLGPILVGLETRGFVEITGTNEEGRKRYRRTDKAISDQDE
jgi:hypothetical protein